MSCGVNGRFGVRGQMRIKNWSVTSPNPNVLVSYHITVQWSTLGKYGGRGHSHHHSTRLLWSKICGMFPISCLTSQTFTSYGLDGVHLTWFQQDVRPNVMWVYICYGNPRNLKKHTAEWNESISQQMFKLNVAHCLITLKNLVKYVSRIPCRLFLFFFPHNICISKAIRTYCVFVSMPVCSVLLSAAAGERKIRCGN